MIFDTTITSTSLTRVTLQTWYFYLAWRSEKAFYFSSFLLTRIWYETMQNGIQPLQNAVHCYFLKFCVLFLSLWKETPNHSAHFSRNIAPPACYKKSGPSIVELRSKGNRLEMYIVSPIVYQSILHFSPLLSLDRPNHTHVYENFIWHLSAFNLSLLDFNIFRSAGSVLLFDNSP